VTLSSEAPPLTVIRSSYLQLGDSFAETSLKGLHSFDHLLIVPFFITVLLPPPWVFCVTLRVSMVPRGHPSRKNAAIRLRGWILGSGLMEVWAILTYPPVVFTSASAATPFRLGTPAAWLFYGTGSHLCEPGRHGRCIALRSGFRGLLPLYPLFSPPFLDSRVGPLGPAPQLSPGLA